MFKRLYMWLGWSSYLRCKHCCLFCKHFNDCVAEIEEMESKLDMNNFFD